MAKTANFNIRIDPALKRVYEDWCWRHRTNPSDALREYMRKVTSFREPKPRKA